MPASVSRWRRAVGRRGHLHTLVVPPYAEPLGWIWTELGADTAVAAFELSGRREQQRAEAAHQEVSAAARRPRRLFAR